MSTPSNESATTRLLNGKAKSLANSLGIPAALIIPTSSKIDMCRPTTKEYLEGIEVDSIWYQSVRSMRENCILIDKTGFYSVWSCSTIIERRLPWLTINAKEEISFGFSRDEQLFKPKIPAFLCELAMSSGKRIVYRKDTRQWAFAYRWSNCSAS